MSWLDTKGTAQIKFDIIFEQMVGLRNFTFYHILLETPVQILDIIVLRIDSVVFIEKYGYVNSELLAKFKAEHLSNFLYNILIQHEILKANHKDGYN